MAEHRWSGWPGAYCLDCGSEDPVENALALGWIDFLGTDPDGIGPNPAVRAWLTSLALAWRLSEREAGR